jgi:hypothetical protein
MPTEQLTITDFLNIAKEWNLEERQIFDYGDLLQSVSSRVLVFD